MLLLRPNLYSTTLQSPSPDPTKVQGQRFLGAGTCSGALKSTIHYEYLWIESLKICKKIICWGCPCRRKLDRKIQAKALLLKLDSRREYLQSLQDNLLLYGTFCSAVFPRLYFCVLLVIFASFANEGLESYEQFSRVEQNHQKLPWAAGGRSIEALDLCWKIGLLSTYHDTIGLVFRRLMWRDRKLKHIFLICKTWKTW